jgi:hypothetical protein
MRSRDLELAEKYRTASHLIAAMLSGATN